MKPEDIYGEQPEFTESEKEEIRADNKRKNCQDRKKQPGIIHHSHNFPRCSICGCIVRVPAGSCMACTNCGSQIGGCS